MRALAAPPVARRAVALETATIREFDGGLNLIDSDLNLDTSYSVVSDNVYRWKDGSTGVRYGTKFLIDVGDELYQDPEITPIPQGTGTAVGDMTGGGGLAAAFDGVQNPAAGSCAQATDLTGWIGKDYGAGNEKVPYGAIIYPDSLGRFLANSRPATIDVHFEASNDGSAWDRLDSALGIDVQSVPLDGMNLISEALATGATAYRYFRVYFELDPGHVQATTALFGEVEFAEVSGDPAYVGGDVVYMREYDAYYVIFMSTGKIYRSPVASPSLELIWSDGIAGGLPGSPSGWSPDLKFVSTTIFGGQLIACNGIDKPITLTMSGTPIVDYLQDLGTASNANTPIGRYVIGLNDYVVIAGDPLNPTTFHVSAVGTAGTFVGDPAPNDAVSVDISKWHGTDPPEITGLAEFRDNLIVAVESVSMVVNLGVYDATGNHVPGHNDHIVNHGTIAHNTMEKVSNDLFMLDQIGVPSLVRGLFTATAEPKRVSELIDPAIQNNVARLTKATVRDRCFALHHRLESQYLLFIPDQDGRQLNLPVDPLIALKEGSGVIRVYNPYHLLDEGNKVTLEGATAFNQFTAERLNDTHTVRYVVDEDYYDIEIEEEQADFSDPDDITGGGASITSTAEYHETYVYVYTYLKEGNKVRAWSRHRGLFVDAGCVNTAGRVILAVGSNIYILGDRSEPVYKDYEDSEYERPIDFEWELPWADFDQRLKVKHSRYIGHDSIGTASFTCEMYVDENVRNAYGERIPMLSMQFAGGNRGGYGRGEQSYGGGRPTNDPRLYGWTSRFKVAKLRYSGAADAPLRFVSISLLYQRGSIRVSS